MKCRVLLILLSFTSLTYISQCKAGGYLSTAKPEESKRNSPPRRQAPPPVVETRDIVPSSGTRALVLFDSFKYQNKEIFYPKDAQLNPVSDAIEIRDAGLFVMYVFKKANPHPSEDYFGPNAKVKIPERVASLDNCIETIRNDLRRLGESLDNGASLTKPSQTVSQSSSQNDSREEVKVSFKDLAGRDIATIEQYVTAYNISANLSSIMFQRSETTGLSRIRIALPGDVIVILEVGKLTTK